MCGIFGVINFKESIEVSRVLAARDVLAHRGPDDAGVYLSHYNKRSLAEARDDTSTGSVQANKEKVDLHHSADKEGFHKNNNEKKRVENNYFVALAHRRLSIIDLSPAAHQPMTSEDGRYTIVYNGEIYNYKGLIPSPSPKEKGVFKSNSDTEVILYLYSKYGKDCLHFLRGMFAFAIWDDKEKTLFAARDRFGIKPFYYLYDANPPDGETAFIFSSELKAIKHYKGNLTINNNALDAFLRMGSVPAPMTIYNEVASLLPGHYLTINNSQCKINNYWKFSDLFEKSSVDSRQSSRKAIDVDSRLSADKAGLCEKDGQEEWSGHTSMALPLSMTEMDPSLRGNDRQDIISNEENVISSEARNLRVGNISQSNDESVPSPEGMALPEIISDQHLPTGRAVSPKGTGSIQNPIFGIKYPASSIKPQPQKLKYDDAAKKIIRTALLDTIEAHLVADVEVGAFLSGGIDSTAIVSLMRQCGKEKIKTVSIVFPDSRFDESKYSRLAAKTYNTEHIEIPFYEKDLLGDFENIIAVMDQPTIDGINTYFVSKAAKQAGLKVVLSGLGADELFGGYPSFHLIPKYKRIKNLPFAKMFMKIAAPLLKYRLPAKAIHYMKNPDEPNAEYKLVRGLFTDEELQTMGWKSNSHQSSVLSPLTINDPMTNDQLTNDPMTNDQLTNDQLTNLQYVSMMESCYYMRNQLLRDSDVFSMAHSIELRVPFVYHKLYKAVLPYLDDAYDKNFPKKMLVDAVRDIPDEIVHRPKMGFTFPFEDWIRNGQLKDLMTDSIRNLNSKFNLYSLSFDLERLHWSRYWALFIMSKYV